MLPPDYDKIPEPGTISKKKIDEEDKIKNILNAPKVENEKKTIFIKKVNHKPNT